MGEKGIVIALDGPSGAGKGRVARKVAERLNYLYVDSGAMYRAVALCAAEKGIAFNDAEALTALAAGLRIGMEKSPTGTHVTVDGRDVTEAIRQPAVSEGSSLIAVFPALREQLVAQQQRIGAEGGIVMEGRDIGSVVFPQAELRRRYKQQVKQGIPSSLERIQREVEERDRRDTEREVSPLLQAPDAFYLDSTALSADEVVDVIVRLAEKRAGGKDSVVSA
jgi:cytidylate kinase